MLTASLLLAGCQREPIKVGGAFGLSGRQSDLGVSGRNGATLAVEEINAAGGIGGRRVEFLVKDDGQEPEAARRVVSELIDLGVVAIVGHMTSSMTEVTLPLVNQAQVLMVSPTTSAAQFHERDDWLVLLFPSTRSSAAMLVERIAKVDRVRRLAVIHDLSNRAYSGAWLDHVKQSMEGPGSTIAGFPFTSGQATPLGGVAEQALATRPDGVLVVANALDAASICQQIRKRDATVRLYGTDWGFTQALVKHGGAAVEGAVFTYKIDPESPNPAFKRFQQAYQARFAGAPDFAAAFSYEAVMLLADGLRRDLTRAGVRKAVLGLGVLHGLQGDFRIDGFGDVERRHFLMTIRDGRIVPLE